MRKDLPKHIAGIIPVAAPPLEFNFPWHDSLMPIGKDYHAIERAVHSAAKAGCNTIWIVLHRESQPLIKKKIGNWVYDPRTVCIDTSPFTRKKEVPVFYIAVRPTDKGRRDSQAWSALYGAKMAARAALKISKWIMPARYLVVSPYGITSEDSFEKARDFIDEESNLLFTHNNSTFIENNHMPYMFDQDDWDMLDRDFKENYTYDDSRRTFSEVYAKLDTKKCLEFPVDWHYDISDWEKYKLFLKSKHADGLKRPGYLVTHKWYGLVKDH
jgi:hypothetical protein